MNAHATAEMLSAYLDHELPEPEARQVESHLTECARCRSRYDGLHRVVADLRHLERQAPPPTLGHLVARRVAFERGRQGLRDRLEGHLSALGRQSSLLSLFALVIALAVMSLLLAHALEQRRHATIPVIFQDFPSSPMESRTLAGRPLRHEQGLWIEDGVDRAAIEETIEIGSPAFAELFAAHPEIAELEGLGAPAVLAVDGRVIEFRGKSDQ